MNTYRVTNYRYNLGRGLKLKAHDPEDACEKFLIRSLGHGGAWSHVLKEGENIVPGQEFVAFSVMHGDKRVDLLNVRPL